MEKACMRVQVLNAREPSATLREIGWQLRVQSESRDGGLREAFLPVRLTSGCVPWWPSLRRAMWYVDTY